LTQVKHQWGIDKKLRSLGELAIELFEKGAQIRGIDVKYRERKRRAF
jgi:hypothetical protein